MQKTLCYCTTLIICTLIMVATYAMMHRYSYAGYGPLQRDNWTGKTFTRYEKPPELQNTTR